MSAGILMYRRGDAGIDVLLVHPGGPFWRNRDLGAWSIPKGELEDGEDAEAAARLTKALADGRLVLVVDPAGTVRLASAARASYPNLVAAIAVAIAESAASGPWPRPGQGP